MKKLYERLELVVENFDELDIVTASETEIDQADGKVYIPESWYA